MRRITMAPRDGWQKRCEEAGFNYHTIDGKPYWDERAAYVFSAAEIDKIEEATDELHAMCMEHVADVVARGAYREYGFNDFVAGLVQASWKARESHLYGRFDLAYDGNNLKLLEYNADTPTSLLEAAVVQWHWLEDRNLPDQFNSIHETLVDRWKVALGEQRDRIHFTAMETARHEDWGNLHYMLAAAMEAGFECSSINLEQIGWDAVQGYFTDVENKPIKACFKLYPWEFMLADEFGWQIPRSKTRFLEPAWKLLLSTKALLPQLWDKHQGHPLLLPAYLESSVGAVPMRGKWARKPLLAREGSNVSLIEDGKPRALEGSAQNDFYDKRGYVIQQWFDIPVFDGLQPVLGSWVVGDKACGMGLREARGVTGNDSCFVPHYFE